MKKITTLLVVLSILLLSYVAAGPFITMNRIQAAIETKDSEKLTKHVDFPVLRVNLKEQVNDFFMKEAGAQSDDNPWVALALSFTSSLVERIVEAFVTPEGIAKLLEGDKPKLYENEKPTPNNSKQTKPSLKNTRFKYHGFSEFSIWLKTKNQKEDIQLILSRQGIKWKLTNIIIPTDSIPTNTLTALL
ncbi:MAG: DUF2939 domain-containing protein [Pseudomonadota bacterium]